VVEEEKKRFSSIKERNENGEPNTSKGNALE
jgi:hypothetical protein